MNGWQSFQLFKRRHDSKHNDTQLNGKIEEWFTFDSFYRNLSSSYTVKLVNFTAVKLTFLEFFQTFTIMVQILLQLYCFNVKSFTVHH